jgi:hypothetical protein
VQADILDRGPDNRQAAGLRREHVDLIGALPHIAEQTLNGIGRLHVPVQRLRKGIKRQEVLFVLGQASYRFWIAHSILGFEGCELGQRLLLRRLVPDANEFSLDVAALSSGDSIEHVALLVQQTARTGRGRKPVRDGAEQPIMPVGDDQIDLGYSSCPQVLQQADPSVFALLGARAPRQNLFVACQIHP